MKPTPPDSSVTMRRPSSSSVRRQSIVEAAEAHFDKNTIILCVNVLILMVLMGILYMVATSAMNVGGYSIKDEH
ncbi:hypothetical protein FO519_008061 [Halicephalobus sp. NKZ332]|nr:hypothetical protein FO519_008061 [Halicephalobus sp. NKZ332]